MDLLLAICQGLGLAIAAGLVIGVVLPPIMPAWGAVAGAAPLGILACAAPLNGADEALWPALPVGLLGAGLAASVSRQVAAGAARREQAKPPEVGELTAQAPPAVMAWIVLAAALAAVLSLFAPPVSLVALAALGWLAFSRRRREQRKHEGLRVLR